MKYLLHAGAIINLVQSVEALIAFEIQQKGALPPKVQIQAILDNVRNLVDDGVIEFPGIDAKVIDGVLNDIEAAVLGFLK